MRKYILSLTVILLNLLSPYAQTVNVADVTLNPSETKVISINLENTQTNIVSFQMDITLPEGITLNKEGCKLSRRFTDEDQELTIGKQPNGDYRLTSTSFSLKPISGTSGEIIKLSLSASETAAGGTASISNIRLATNNSDKFTPSNTLFKVNVPYTLTYKVDGVEYKTSSIPCGTVLISEEDPIKEGHTFSGWDEIPETMPPHDVTVTGTFTINQYTVTFKVDGEVFKTYTQDYGTAITTPESPTREGYTFSGWQDVASTVPAQDVTYEANFTVNNYTLKFVADGTVVSDKSVDYGSAITAPNAPAKTGYTFVSWGNVAATMPANDVTYTAQYSINQYTVTFKVDGEVFKTLTQDYGSTVSIPAAPTKEGYSFSGWQNVVKTVPAEDVVYEANFTVNQYTLKFVADNSVVSEEVVDFGSTINVPQAPAKEGYTFASWGEVASTMPAKDVTYTAEYKINQYSVVFKIDGEVYKAFMQDFGTIITVPEVPVKEGYTFSGWNTKIAETVPANDLEYTGSFSVNSYKLTYFVDNEEYYTTSVNYGSQLIPQDNPQKTGYTFSGWDNVPSTMPANDVVVRGIFSINQYTVTFKIDGEVFKTFTQDFGSAITAPEAPAKEGYTFVTWGEVASKMPAKDVTYTAEYKVNQYTLKFMADGKTVSETSIDFGSAISAPQAPAKKGYTFVTWGEVASKMPAKDVTYTAEYKVNQYTITFKVDGEVFKIFTQDYGSNITIPAAPTKEGYSFSGWKNVVKTVPASDVTYEATFTVNQYTLKFVADDKTVSETSIDFGSTITAPQAPAKEGYTFVSWGNVASTMPAKDVTYTAEYKVNQYKLSYLIDGRVYKTYMIDFGSEITPEDKAEDDDYYYGWEDVPETMPAHDVEVNAYITKALGWAKSIDKNTTIYTLDGQKVLTPQKGNIYIINGKKVRY